MAGADELMEPGPQFQQLAMFHTAKELIDDHTPGDFSMYAHGSRFWREGWENKEREVAQAARMGGGRGHVPDVEGGIRTPVRVKHKEDGTRVLADGHHRVAASHAHNPQALIPVNHSEWNNPLPSSWAG